MEILITNFIEVYNGLESMLSVVELSEDTEPKPNFVKAKTLLKKILKNFKVVIFETLKDGKIKDYLYVQYVFRFTFLNVISLAFLIKELYSLMLSTSDKDKDQIVDDKLNKKAVDIRVLQVVVTTLICTDQKLSRYAFSPEP